MKKSTPKDREIWPREQYPHWNKMMDYIDGQIDAGLVDIKFDFIPTNSTRSIEVVAEEFMRMVTAPDVAVLID